MASFRPTVKVMIEQPMSSWLFKQRNMLEVLSRLRLQCNLTYLGFFGHELLKGTHLQSNLPGLEKVQRRATAEKKEKHRQRILRMNQRKAAQGIRINSFYVKTTNGKFHGGPDLAKSAIYPQKFVTTVFQIWRTYYAQSSAPVVICID